MSTGSHTKQTSRILSGAAHKSPVQINFGHVTFLNFHIRGGPVYTTFLTELRQHVQHFQCFCWKWTDSDVLQETRENKKEKKCTFCVCVGHRQKTPKACMDCRTEEWERNDDTSTKVFGITAVHWVWGWNIFSFYIFIELRRPCWELYVCCISLCQIWHFNYLCVFACMCTVCGCLFWKK